WKWHGHALRDAELRLRNILTRSNRHQRGDDRYAELHAHRVRTQLIAVESEFRLRVSEQLAHDVGNRHERGFDQRYRQWRWHYAGHGRCRRLHIREPLHDTVEARQELHDRGHLPGGCGRHADGDAEPHG